MNEVDSRPLVLLTNDDGYGTPGIEAMVAAIEAWATVLVIAPAKDQSACSHQFSFRRPLAFKMEGPLRYSLHGTPADCVYWGIFGGDRVARRVPDLVVSGLNLGCNLGLDTYYSGTVAGAREAAIRGVPGMAVSAEPQSDLHCAARLCSELAKCFFEVLKQTMSVVLNVNVPAKGSWALRRTRLGHRVYGEGVQVRRDPQGGEVLWLGESGEVSNDLTPGTDTHAVHAGFVSVTGLPLRPHDEEETDSIADAVAKAYQSRSEK